MKYGALFEIICDLRDPSEKRKTIEARVKQFQQLGVPQGVNVGRGAKVDYTPEMVWEFLLVSELTLCGFPAKTARDYVWRSRDALMASAAAGNKLFALRPINGRDSSILIDIPRIAAAIQARNGG
jgi:hypothetical protein